MKNPAAAKDGELDESVGRIAVSSGMRLAR